MGQIAEPSAQPNPDGPEQGAFVKGWTIARVDGIFQLFETVSSRPENACNGEFSLSPDSGFG